jgi:hypothetical protein
MRKEALPCLPSLLPFMKFQTFKAPNFADRPDDSFLSWFKAQGPPSISASCTSCKQLGHLFFSDSAFPSFAFSHSTATINPNFQHLPSSPAGDYATMANIPIDTLSFVPPGF